MGEPAERRAAFDPRRWHSDRVAGGVLFLLGALIVAETLRELPIGTISNPGPGYMPLLLAMALGAFGLLVAWRGGDSPALGTLEIPELRHAAKILVAGGFATFAFERLGFRLTVFALAVFLIGVIERRPPVTTAIVAAGLSFGVFYVFNDFLRVPLPIGLLGF